MSGKASALLLIKAQNRDSEEHETNENVCVYFILMWAKCQCFELWRERTLLLFF